jgi:DNA-binding NarL/FixJ family response regulator
MQIGIIDYNSSFREMLKKYLTQLNEVEEIITDYRIENFLKKIKDDKNISIIFIHEKIIRASSFGELQDIKNKFPKSRIVVISGGDTTDPVLNWIKKEIKFNILNALSEAHFIEIIERIRNENLKISPDLLLTMLKKVTKDSQIKNLGINIILTKRELEVMNNLLNGLTYNDISILLQISPHTVNDHVKKIYFKLNISSKGELLSLFIP